MPYINQDGGPSPPPNKYFIQEHLHKEIFHGGIGNIDAEKILLARQFQPILFPYMDNFSWKAKLARITHLRKVSRSIGPGAVVVFQFPLYARVHKMLARMLAKRKDVRVICLIADINGLKDGNDRLLDKEIKELKRYHHFIVHNEKMRQWLGRSIGQRQYAQLEFFDFLAPVPDTRRVKAKSVVFAGNLEKSGFLSNLKLWQSACPGVQLDLYGMGYSSGNPVLNNVSLRGCLEPYSLPAVLDNSFGLIWDGDSIEGSKGSLGNYMQYISHHKLSLYVLSGLPVITASWAASVDIVEKYRIGFAVNSMLEIEERINAITDEEYAEMAANARKLAPRIAKGENLARALVELGA